MDHAERRRLRIDPDRFADWDRLVAVARGEERGHWWERREAQEVRVVLVMLEAGLTAREIDVFWLRVGCQWRTREIAAQLRLSRMVAWRSWITAEDKLRAWVTRNGLKASPLWRSRETPGKSGTAAAYG